MWRLIYAAAEQAAETAQQTGQGAENGGGQQPAPPGSGLMQMLPMLIIFGGIMYFFMIRPGQKRERERREMLAALTKGDRVVTSGGICGTIVGLNDKSVVLRVDDDVTMEFVRGAISQVTSTDGDEDDEED